MLAQKYKDELWFCRFGKLILVFRNYKDKKNFGSKDNYNIYPSAQKIHGKRENLHKKDCGNRKLRQSRFQPASLSPYQDQKSRKKQNLNFSLKILHLSAFLIIPADFLS